MAAKIDINNLKTDLTEDELQLIYDFLSSFFIGLLKPVKPHDLKYYINKMTIIDLSHYLKQIPKPFRVKLSEMASNNNELLKNLLSPDMLLIQASKSRPDLLKVLNTEKGRIWLKRFMLYIHKLLLEL